jgi:hypothetical protein
MSGEKNPLWAVAAKLPDRELSNDDLSEITNRLPGFGVLTYNSETRAMEATFRSPSATEASTALGDAIRSALGVTQAGISDMSARHDPYGLEAIPDADRLLRALTAPRDFDGVGDGNLRWTISDQEIGASPPSDAERYPQ